MVLNVMFYTEAADPNGESSDPTIKTSSLLGKIMRPAKTILNGRQNFPCLGCEIITLDTTSCDISSKEQKGVFPDYHARAIPSFDRRNRPG
jgi:hypothetical protein